MVSFHNYHDGHTSSITRTLLIGRITTNFSKKMETFDLKIGYYPSVSAIHLQVIKLCTFLPWHFIKTCGQVHTMSSLWDTKHLTWTRQAGWLHTSARDRCCGTEKNPCFHPKTISCHCVSGHLCHWLSYPVFTCCQSLCIKPFTHKSSCCCCCCCCYYYYY